MLNIPVSVDVSSEQSEASRTYSIDFDNKRIIGYVDGVDAVKQAIAKAIRTPRFLCAVYNNQYGSEIRESITVEDATEDYIKTSIPFLVEDALKPDERIISVSDFSVIKQNDEVSISFLAQTIYGEISVEEVI